MSQPTFARGELRWSPTIHGMRNRMFLTLLLALIVAAVAAPAQAATKGCDLTGDTKRANDCITHSHVGATADGNMRRGDTITLREHIADALRGKNLVVEVQVRRVARDGKKGPWVGLRRTRWTAAETAAHSTRTVDVCRAGVAGRYEFRTATVLPRKPGGRTARQSIVGPAIATSAATTVNLPNSGGGACPNSPDDEAIIEYFNQVQFSLGFYVLITDQGTSFSLQLNCPPQQGPHFPPANFGMFMSAAGAPAGIGCNTGEIVLDKAQMPSYASCQNNGQTCTFDFLVYNEKTQAVYSDTIGMITFGPGNNAYLPNLNPATLPICPASFNPCILTGTCTQSTTKLGTLSLCDSADSSVCTPPPTNDTYAYNENVYFETVLQTTS